MDFIILYGSQARDDAVHPQQSDLVRLEEYRGQTFSEITRDWKSYAIDQYTRYCRLVGDYLEREGNPAV